MGRSQNLRFANYRAARVHLAEKHNDKSMRGYGYEDVARQILKDEGWKCGAFNRTRIDRVIKRYVIEHNIKFLPKEKKEKRKSPPKKQKNHDTKSFYASWEWKKLRYSTIQKYGPVCMCCGASKDDGVRIVVDHIKPVSKFPHLKLDPNNLQVLCNSCNMGKSNTDFTDFRPVEGNDDFVEPSLSVLMGESIH